MQSCLRPDEGYKSPSLTARLDSLLQSQSYHPHSDSSKTVHSPHATLHSQQPYSTPARPDPAYHHSPPQPLSSHPIMSSSIGSNVSVQYTGIDADMRSLGEEMHTFELTVNNQDCTIRASTNNNGATWTHRGTKGPYGWIVGQDPNPLRAGAIDDLFKRPDQLTRAWQGR